MAEPKGSVSAPASTPATVQASPPLACFEPGQAPTLLPQSVEVPACFAEDAEPAVPLMAGSPCDRPLGADAFVGSQRAMMPIFRGIQALPFSERAECASRRFLGVPYARDPLGEGASSPIDKDPLSRADTLDCMTFIEESMAMALASSFSDFQGILFDIRYRAGGGTYATRNHFVEADWIEENTRKGYVQDITRQVGGSTIAYESALIDRSGWILRKRDLDPDQKRALIAEQHALGIDRPIAVTLEIIPYAALAVFDQGEIRPNPEIFNRIPEDAIIVFTRPQEKALQIGVIVMHMGWLFIPRDAEGRIGEPIVRHALRGHGVVEEPLLSIENIDGVVPEGVLILRFNDRK